LRQAKVANNSENKKESLGCHLLRVIMVICASRVIEECHLLRVTIE
jgi:hypothetical protein